MNNIIHRATLVAAAVALAVGASQGKAATVTLPLNGQIHTGADILNYFDGGSDSVSNDGTGPNLGFTFSSNATAQKAGDSASTGDGKFENNPSGMSEILYFSPTSGITDTVNFAAGFTGVSFNYSISANSNFPSTVDLWSGTNGTGTLLDAISLTPAATTVACVTHGDAYCTWSLASAASFGTAESMTFGASTGNAEYTEFDGLTLTTPVPLPGAALLMISGLGGLGGLLRRRCPGVA